MYKEKQRTNLVGCGPPDNVPTPSHDNFPPGNLHGKAKDNFGGTEPNDNFGGDNFGRTILPDNFPTPSHGNFPTPSHGNFPTPSHDNFPGVELPKNLVGGGGGGKNRSTGGLLSRKSPPVQTGRGGWEEEGPNAYKRRKNPHGPLHGDGGQGIRSSSLCQGRGRGGRVAHVEEVLDYGHRVGHAEGHAHGAPPPPTPTPGSHLGIWGRPKWSGDILYSGGGGVGGPPKELTDLCIAEWRSGGVVIMG